MNDPTIALIVAVLSGLTGVASIILTFRSANRKTDADAKTALDARIDARVATALEEAWERIKDLENEVDKLKKGEMETRAIIRTFFQRLLNWDRRGRRGAMPMPTHAEMARLGVEDLAITDTEPQPTPPDVDSN